ncbi:hypothetical protein TSAR_013650 [Trichomalopsis sarcophagae]|uniref:Uncharacterized protein n=1 Tax=Trichomalopsis sarcophagae TaxID=543379 RepID=A0A232EEK6_9HYME|nr:hypothetical protein TSAR_013650 [Trichomalopsis sarcophagae]
MGDQDALAKLRISSNDELKFVHDDSDGPILFEILRGEELRLNPKQIVQIDLRKTDIVKLAHLITCTHTVVSITTPKIKNVKDYIAVILNHKSKHPAEMKVLEEMDKLTDDNVVLDDEDSDTIYRSSPFFKRYDCIAYETLEGINEVVDTDSGEEVTEIEITNEFYAPKFIEHLRTNLKSIGNRVRQLENRTKPTVASEILDAKIKRSTVRYNDDDDDDNAQQLQLKWQPKRKCFRGQEHSNQNTLGKLLREFIKVDNECDKEEFLAKRKKLNKSEANEMKISKQQYSKMDTLLPEKSSNKPERRLIAAINGESDSSKEEEKEKEDENPIIDLEEKLTEINNYEELLSNEKTILKQQCFKEDTLAVKKGINKWDQDLLVNMNEESDSSEEGEKAKKAPKMCHRE